MKSIRFMLVLFAAIASARADSITLVDGRKLEDAKVVSQTPTHVTIRHGSSITQTSKSNLPEELRAAYPIDEAAAERMRKRDEIIRDSQVREAKAREENSRELRLIRAKQHANDKPPGQTYQVEYRVKGWLPYVDLTMSTSGGKGTEQRQVKLTAGDWTKNFTASTGAFLYLSGQLPGNLTSETTFEIRVDGVVVETVSVNGPHVIGTVSHTLK